MNHGALVFSVTDTPAEDKLLAIDAGLEQYDYAAAPLSEVKQLAAFATEASAQVVGGAIGRTWGKCCELTSTLGGTGAPHCRCGLASAAGVRGSRQSERLQHLLPHHTELPGAAVLSEA